ncbi:MAG TPA: hypothetical protein VLG12_03200 [Candidatus Saccharimonadales bacterium]|nr:hypothetical protein [Candidatus Saccharimonadales bacterium]
MEQAKSFLIRYRFLVIISVIFLFGLIIFFLISRGGKTTTSSLQQAEPTAQMSQTVKSNPTIPQSSNSSKIWQISFSFNTKTQQLSIKKITMQQGTVKAATQNETSPYKLFVLDKNQQVLFQTDISIAQQILYDVYFPPGATPSGLPQLETLDTLVAVPYFSDAQTMQVRKNGQTILTFTPPKELGFLKFPSLIQQSYAATCDLLHIVFISDGYTDMTKFHADAQRAEATYTSKAPFSTHADIFDFKTIDNSTSNPLGCKTNNALNVYCVYTGSNLTKISNTVFAAYPQLPHDPTYTKIVVLVDGAPQPFTGGGLVLGVANTLGGQFGVFQNQLFFESTATMEVLGHDVGQLYDRYVYPPQPGSASDMGNTIPAPYQSNCSTNPQGASFWKNAGVNTGYKGCTSQYMYAPAPLDCSNGQGSSTTLMSAAGCAGTQFDGVEQYYLESVILPKYCKFVPTPTHSPTSEPGSDTNSGSGGGNPKPSQTFKCELDPNCSKSNNNLQMCQLKCTPN